jgi:two-component system OmpR family response regulator
MMLNSSEAPATNLLLIEDDDHMAGELADNLAHAGWNVSRASDGESGLTTAADAAFDVLVVDRMLPGIDGLTLVGELRNRGVQTPVLFLTALGSVADRVAGLERGDDYLVKPFAFAELNARVNALARRRAPAREATVLSVADLVLDRLGRTVVRGDTEIALLPLEFMLLEFLMLNAGRIVTRKMLLEKVWGFQFDPRTNIVETHISHLRRKIQRLGDPPVIATIRGAGYVMGALTQSHLSQPNSSQLISLASRQSTDG